MYIIIADSELEGDHDSLLLRVVRDRTAGTKPYSFSFYVNMLLFLKSLDEAEDNPPARLSCER